MSWKRVRLGSAKRRLLGVALPTRRPSSIAQALVIQHQHSTLWLCLVMRASAASPLWALGDAECGGGHHLADGLGRDAHVWNSNAPWSV